MREPRKRQQAAAAARNNVAPVERSTNLMDMPLDEFQGALAELRQQGVDTDALLRQYRAANSPFAAVNRAAEASSAELAAAGRRPVAGSAGLLSRPIDDAGGVRFEPAAGLLGMLAGAGRQIDAPMAAYQGLIPQGDVPLEALGTASLAALGGGAAVGPRNLLNYDPDTLSAFGATRTGDDVIPNVQVSAETPGTYKVFVDGQSAGEIKIAQGGEGDFVEQSFLDPSFQGRRLGHAAYNLIEQDLGRRLVPSPTGLSSNGAAFWRRRFRDYEPEEVTDALLRSQAAGRASGISDRDINVRLSTLTPNALDVLSPRQNTIAANIDPLSGLFGAMAAEEQRRQRNAP